MGYKVIITEHASKQLEHIIEYIVNTLKNKDAAARVLNDILKTYAKLEDLADVMQICQDPYLAAKGYRKIKLEKHDYLLLYQIDGDRAIVSGIFHMLENYSAKL